MTQINWQYQVNNRAGGYIVTNTDWNDFAGNFRALIDQTTGSGTTDNSPLPIGIDLVNDRVYISDPDSTTPENANHADTTFSVVGTSTFVGNTQQTGTFTVGVDDTGHDVKFFGATASAYMLWDESIDALVIGGDSHLSYGETAPTWKVEFAADDDLTSFTGTAKGTVCVANSQYDANDITAMDFGYTGTDNPVGRIGLKVTGGGSELHFGTSNDYGNGITNDSVIITTRGELELGDDADDTLDANIYFPLRFNFNGYTGGIGGGGTGHGMWIAHNSGSRAIIFAPDETERVRITGGSGYFYHGTTGGSDFPSTDGYMSVKANLPAFAVYRTSSTATNHLMYGYSDVTSTGTKHFEVEVNGDVENTNNSYGALSDERLKGNIADARDFYEDLRKLEVKTFNFTKTVKETWDYDDAGEPIKGTYKSEIIDATTVGPKLLGLIAQDVEKVMPKLIKEDDLSKIKKMKYSVLVPMLLQMCQKMADKIEALEGA